MKLDELKKLIKEEVTNMLEAVGVPSNIEKSATHLYDAILYNLNNTAGVTDENLAEIESTTMSIPVDMDIADMKIKKAKISFDFQSSSDWAWLGMAIASPIEGGKHYNLNVSKKAKFTEIDISINLKVPNFSETGKDLGMFFAKEKVEMIGSLAHELKHFYDAFIKSKIDKPFSSIPKFAAYKAYSSNAFGQITPLNEFLYNIYFTDNMEILVRSSELAAMISAGEITKDKFYDFLTQNRVYQRLKTIRDYSYQELRDKLKEYVPVIKEAFENSDIDYDYFAPDDEIINQVLEIFVNNVSAWKMQSTERITHLYSDQNLLDKLKFLQQQEKIARKFDNNFENYFKYEIAKSSKEAGQIMKKLAKLYSITPDSEITNESIINWEGWYELLDKDKKIVDHRKK